jgi:hypothetical protein
MNKILKFTLIGVGILGFSYGTFWFWEKTVLNKIYQKTVSLEEASKAFRNIK